ncbi:MAG: glutathione-disulfide reductase [Robiginitomaculum sp.]|nr:MAG: glutathione-disulfide reductase [Robiginitomaculum sp.]
MSNYDYDLFVIGAGSGGVRAARLAAGLGKKVAVAEEYRAGGTCVIRGCVPKKYLVYGAEFGKALKEASGYGWSIKGAKFDWASLRDEIQTEVSRLSAIYEGVLERNGADFFSERAEFTGPHSLRLMKSGREITAKHILIATGGTPFVPEMPGKEYAITSDEAFLLDTLPERVMVIGGGYIASEFAGIFAGLGAKTTQVYRGDKLLRGFDEEVREAVGAGQIRNGIDVKFGQSPVSIKKIGNGFKVTFEDGFQAGTDLIMMATGRLPNTQGLGLEKAGVKSDEKGAVIVNAQSKSNVGHIYAVGDVTNRVNLTPVAIREGMAFVETVYKNNPTAYDHSDIPSAVFTMPPVGTVGLSEAQARAKYRTIKVYKTDFRPMKNLLSGSEHRCFMKLITTGKREKVIGVHIVGDYAGEIIQAVGIAVKAGLTKAQFDATCAVHPTLAEELVTL